MRILALAGRRLAASIPTLVLILIGVFLLLQFAPGDTVDAMMAQMGGGDAATDKELRKVSALRARRHCRSHDGTDGWRRCRDGKRASQILRAPPLNPAPARQLSVAAGA